MHDLDSLLAKIIGELLLKLWFFVGHVIFLFTDASSSVNQTMQPITSYNVIKGCKEE